MNIAVVGTGYVGLVTGTCFAETGNNVVCLDLDQRKIESLQKGQVPFFEPSLSNMVAEQMKEKKLRFSHNVDEEISKHTLIFVCVGTPSSQDGSANLDYVYNVVKTVAKLAPKNALVVIKSTVPVGTCDHAKAISLEMKRPDLEVVSNPEFLREGSAVQDCLMPDRVVVGLDNEDLKKIFRTLYEPFVRTGNPILFMDRKSAELAKYTANAMLACRISLINEISRLSEKVGANMNHVREAVGHDKRIGMQYLFPSVGFGGSCFPKDVRALNSLCQKNQVQSPLLKATLDGNEFQKENFVQKILSVLHNVQNKKIALWGLSFKAKTDDVRESPALYVLDRLLQLGAQVCVFDPEAMSNVKKIYEEKIMYAAHAYDALEGADALCVLTEWNRFRNPDFVHIKERMKSAILFDGRNLYNPQELSKLGVAYHSIGR